MIDIAKPTINERNRFSVIWIVPLVALVLGLWMVVDKKMSEGPLVVVSFKTAEGIVAGNTKVKYLNVEVGQVEAISLNDSMNGVLASVRIDHDAKHLLYKDTQFWVVRARVGAGNVSGLSTLLGGTYLELSPGREKAAHLEYIGLETPPLTPAGAAGIKLNLYSEQAASVSTGDAVLYNGYKVGRVEGMGFDEAQRLVHYDLFIDAPFDQLVNGAVRFWNVSGISVNASASGIDIKTGSLDTILLGGVAFRLPDGVEAGAPVEDGADFKLYNNYAALQEQPYEYSLEYVVQFSQSLRGLLPGAPVEYRGIPIGSVTRIMPTALLADPEQQRGAAIPVLIKIEPGRFGLADTQASVDLIKHSLTESVDQGLRASLETGSLITGSLFINIDYYDDISSAELGEFDHYSLIPSVETGFARIEQQLSDFLTKVNELPIEQTMQHFDGMVTSMSELLESVDELLNDRNTQKLSAEMTATLKDVRKILRGLSPDGQIFQSVEGSVSKINQTLYNLDELTRTLTDKPNALILPTKFPSDPLPGAIH
jgi:paraquat-inducible protein B